MANLRMRKTTPCQGVIPGAGRQADKPGSHAGEPLACPDASQAGADGSVARLFQNLILPELARAATSENKQREQRHPTDPQITGSDVDAFCDLLGGVDFSKALAFLDAAGARGVGYDSLLLDLLAGAARRLGFYWETDERAFAEVTIGMSRLHQALQHLAMDAPFQTAQLRTRGRALLAPCPGEQHNFAVMVLDAMFHRAGWQLRTLPSATGRQLGRIAADSAFDMVGLSLSCDDQLPELEKAIATVRRESRNQNVVILVGGRAFSDDPSLALKIGADAAPPDAIAALAAAEILTEAQRRSSHVPAVMNI